MMATAMGPQKTERDRGIMASAAAAAVSTMGRQRRTAESMMASHGAEPSLMSCSIWSTRITELRMIMPNSAMTPRLATKPSGRCSSSKAKAAPATPSGPVRNTSKAREKLCSCSISRVKMMKMASGRFAAIDASASPLSAATPFTVMR